MKKAFVSPLCSALVIPGLGQIVNQDLRKGLLLLGSVFLLFIAGIIKLVRLVNAVFRPGEANLADPEIVIARLWENDPSILWYLLAAFASLWLYSVVDAYLKGRKLDQLEKGDVIG